MFLADEQQSRMAVGIRIAAVLPQSQMDFEGPPVPLVVVLMAVQGVEPVHRMDSERVAQRQPAMVVEIQPWMPLPMDLMSLPSLRSVAVAEAREHWRRMVARPQMPVAAQGLHTCH